MTRKGKQHIPSGMWGNTLQLGGNELSGPSFFQSARCSMTGFLGSLSTGISIFVLMVGFSDPI
jgi:hypothetical protein